MAQNGSKVFKLFTDFQIRSHINRQDSPPWRGQYLCLPSPERHREITPRIYMVWHISCSHLITHHLFHFTLAFHFTLRLLLKYISFPRTLEETHTHTHLDTHDTLPWPYGYAHQLTNFICCCCSFPPTVFNMPALSFPSPISEQILLDQLIFSLSCSFIYSAMYYILCILYIIYNCVNRIDRVSRTTDPRAVLRRSVQYVGVAFSPPP